MVHIFVINHDVILGCHVISDVVIDNQTEQPEDKRLTSWQCETGTGLGYRAPIKTVLQNGFFASILWVNHFRHFPCLMAGL